MFCYKVFAGCKNAISSHNTTSMFSQEYLIKTKNYARENTLLFVFKRLKDAYEFCGSLERIWICECDKLIEAPEYVAYPISDSIQCFWDNFDINNPTKKMPDYIAKRETPEGTYFTKWVIPLNRLK